MNADRLLTRYERIADAPDAVPRLRRFILDLAVRGKLVEQDPADEPAAVSLVERKRHRSQREVRPLVDLSGWLVAPVASLLQFQYGKGMKASERLDEGPVPVFGSNGLVGYCETPLTEAPAIIVGRKGSAGALNLCDGPSWATDVAYFVEAPHYFDLRYLLIGLQTLNLGSLGKGVKPGLSRADAYDLPLSVPPLAEQHRIVAKIDELMALCDRLEKARADREATRDQLSASSLARLDASDPDPMVFRNHAAFVLEHLTPLTTRRDQIKALRQTILNLAVRGKLVEQEWKDDCGNQGQLRSDAVAETFDAQAFEVRAAIFNLPVNWAIEPLSRVASHIVDCLHTTPKWTDDGVLCIKTNQVKAGQLDLSSPYFVSENTYKARVSRLEPRQDDVLYIREGGILGVACLVPSNTRLCLGQRLMHIRTNSAVAPQFLELCLNSRWIAEFAVEKTTGGAAPRVNMSIVRSYPIPLPPLAEQHRIVAKVDKLIALCDRLEASLTTGDDTRCRLLGALLIEALEPGGSHASEQAERAAAHG